MALEWAPSADGHGIAHEDALHAMLNAVHAELGFEAARPPATLAPDLYIGPQRNASAPLLEVMTERRPGQVLYVFHVMPLRDKFRSRMNAALIARRMEKR